MSKHRPFWKKMDDVSRADPKFFLPSLRMQAGSSPFCFQTFNFQNSGFLTFFRIYLVFSWNFSKENAFSFFFCFLSAISLCFPRVYAFPPPSFVRSGTVHKYSQMRTLLANNQKTAPAVKPGRSDSGILHFQRRLSTTASAESMPSMAADMMPPA